MVGARGFEPPASCSQSRRATRLRHAPILLRINNTESGFRQELKFEWLMEMTAGNVTETNMLSIADGFDIKKSTEILPTDKSQVQTHIPRSRIASPV